MKRSFHLFFVTIKSQFEFNAQLPVPVQITEYSVCLQLTALIAGLFKSLTNLTKLNELELFWKEMEGTEKNYQSPQLENWRQRHCMFTKSSNS